MFKYAKIKNKIISGVLLLLTVGSVVTSHAFQVTHLDDIKNTASEKADLKVRFYLFDAEEGKCDYDDKAKLLYSYVSRGDTMIWGTPSTENLKFCVKAYYDNGTKDWHDGPFFGANCNLSIYLPAGNKHTPTADVSTSCNIE